MSEEVPSRPGRHPRSARGPEVERVGIVVGRQDFGEQDRIVRLLGPDGGRYSAFAPAARRAFSPFGSLDLGARVAVRMREGRGDLWRLTSAEVEDGRVHIRDSVERVATAAYVCDVASALAGVDHPEPRMFGLLETALLLLDATTAPPGAAFVAGFEGKALSFAGVAPVLDRCALCGRPLGDEPLTWSVGAGGAIHAREREPGRDQVAVEPAHLASLEEARRRPLRESLDQCTAPGPAGILANLIEHHAGRALPSRALLNLL